MLKTELIEKVAKLEIQLHNEKNKITNLLNTAEIIFYWKNDTRNMYSPKSITNITNTNELFYEIWKLIEFRNNILDEKNYIRQQESNQNELEYMREKLNKQTI